MTDSNLNHDRQPLKRRDFLRGAGLAAGAVAAVPLTATVADAAPVAPETAGSGYRETEHVRRVYETARF